MFEITRRSPWTSRSIQELFDSLSNDAFLGGLSTGSEEGTLPLDVSENEGEVVVRASLPGFSKDQIDIQIHNGVLSIKADYNEVEETKDEKFYRKERRSGSVSRRLALPGVVADAKASAELKDGVLTLRIPLAEVARPKQIQVK